MTAMRNYINPKTNKAAPLICEPGPSLFLSVCVSSVCLSNVTSAAYEFMSEHKEALDAAMKYERDFTYDFFAYKTLERSYLSKLAGHIVERPQVRLSPSLSAAAYLCLYLCLTRPRKCLSRRST